MKCVLLKYVYSLTLLSQLAVSKKSDPGLQNTLTLTLTLTLQVVCRPGSGFLDSASQLNNYENFKSILKIVVKGTWWRQNKSKELVLDLSINLNKRVLWFWSITRSFWVITDHKKPRTWDTTLTSNFKKLRNIWWIRMLAYIHDRHCARFSDQATRSHNERNSG